MKVIDIFTALMLVKVSGNYSYIKAHPNVLFKYIVCYIKYISIKLSFLKKFRLYIKQARVLIISSKSIPFFHTTGI